ncbi:MAG: site-specific integrase [Cyanobacteriota bacterium]|nr:site-specific integrase [Cyanobacteriota bacterium]
MTNAVLPTSNLPSLTINDFLITSWLHGKSHDTQLAYRRDIACFWTILEPVPLTQIALQDLQQFATALATRGDAPATQRRRLNTLKSLLTYAHELGELLSNPGRLLKPPIICISR